MAEITVLLADDHTMFRQGVHQILDAEPGIQVVGEAKNGEEAVQMAERLKPDVVLMDINMPKLDGVRATRRIMEGKEPLPTIIMLSMHRQDEYIFEAIKAGAKGYFLKDSDARDLIDALHSAVRGEAVLEPELARKVLDEFRRLSSGSHKAVTGLASLSDRETEILRLVAQGLSNQEIADRLHLAQKTVKNQLYVIFQKLHLNNRTQAALYALRKGLVSLEDLEDEIL
jgi:DNA-binding NarL/FixJ family response regulator